MDNRRRCVDRLEPDPSNQRVRPLSLAGQELSDARRVNSERGYIFGQQPRECRHCPVHAPRPARSPLSVTVAKSRRAGLLGDGDCAGLYCQCDCLKF